MCLQTSWLLPKIAEEDIIVYKELCDNLRAPYTNFKYEFDKIYETEMEYTDDFSSFDEVATNWKNTTVESGITLKSIGKGFHSVISKKRLEDGCGCIFKCVIPKGAEYYMDGTGLIVSNKIIVESIAE